MLALIYNYNWQPSTFILSGKDMKFDEYLKLNRIKQAEFSRRSGIDKTSICKFVDADRTPDFMNSLRIKATSGGAITEYDNLINSTLTEIDLLKKKAGY